MELAENVAGKRTSFFKPENFDTKFGDSAYLATDAGKSRLRGYLTTFGYMVLCGVLLLLGGGTFFIYESVVMENTSKSPGEDRAPVGRSTPLHDPSVDKEKMHYAREFQIVAFVFIGVGLVLFVVGAPLATQFYSRYKQVKDSERSPILDPVDGKGSKVRIYNPRNTESSLDSSGSKSFNKKKMFKTKRKSTPSWMFRSKRSFSKEGFRFAAHRHPSMNPIAIDSSGYFDRRFSENSSGDSTTDEELPTIAGSPQHPSQSRRSITGFFSRMFGSATEEHLQIIEKNDKSNAIEDDDFAKSYEEIRGSTPRQSRGETSGQPTEPMNGENLAFDQGGLYNLGE